ncbi:MAG: hypothetical protein IJI22_01665 [Bacilli bacterium]|nr:hypothetical protein [Bacilli bacterium]
METKEKKKGNGGLVFLVILLLLICCGLGGFIFVNKDKIFSDGEVVTTKTSSEKSEVNDKTVMNTVEYGLKDCLNGDENVVYRPNSSFSAINLSVSVQEDLKTAIVEYDGIKLCGIYGGECGGTSDGTRSRVTKNFDKKITQVLVTGYGQAVGHEVILYLMEDGTVQYTPLYKDVKYPPQDENQRFNSYGTLEGVEDVVSLMEVASGVKEGAGWGMNIIAKRSDGNYYDLSKVLQATGNFEA